MRELVEPEVAAQIYKRAQGKCECENLRCKHVAKHCRNASNRKSGIALPSGVSDSFYQRPSRSNR